MTNTPNLFEYRLGVEATDGWGTAVAQSVKLMNIESMNLVPIVQGTQIKDMRGSMAPGHQSVLNEVRAEATLSGWLNLEQSPYWFNSLLQDVAPTSDADGNTWNWVAPTTAPAINSFTIAKGIVGDVNSVKSITGATVNTMSISGAVNEPVTLSIGLIGNKISTDTFDSDAEADVTTRILTGCGVTLYIDPASDAVGTTEIETGAFDFSLDLNANRQTYGHLNSCVHDDYREAKFDGALTLGLELDSTSAAYIDAILNADSDGLIEKVVRIKMTSDTSYLQIDFNGIALESPQLFTDRDGVSTIDLTLNAQYNSVLGNWLKVEAANTVEAF